MTSLRSDDVLDALEAVVSARAASDFPSLNRNAVLDDALTALDNGALSYLNMVDGDVRSVGEALGTDDGYELEQDAKFELIVKAQSEPAARSAIAGIANALHDEIAVSGADGGALEQLGCWAAVSALKRENLATEGIPGIKGAEIVVTLTFISDRPF
nr:hypothetical protein [uncultured Cohaesibacter sp.]